MKKIFQRIPGPLKKYGSLWDSFEQSNQLDLSMVEKLVYLVKSGMGKFHSTSKSSYYLLDNLIKKKRFDLFEKFVDDLVPNVASVGSLEYATMIIDWYEKSGLIPPVKLLNTLLFSIARNNNFHDTQSWIETIKSRYPSRHMYKENVLTNALLVSLKEDPTGTTQIYDTLQSKPLDVHIYTTLLRNSIQHPDLFRKILNSLENSKIPQTHVTETVLLQFKMKHESVAQVIAYFEAIISKDGEISIFFINSMIHYYFDNNMVNEATSLYGRISQLQLAPDASTFQLLIENFTKRNMFQSAFGFYRQLQEFNIARTPDLWKIIISLFCKSKDHVEAERVFSEYKRSGMFEPSVFIYCDLMNVNAKSKNYTRVLSLYNEMLAIGILETDYTRRYLIIGCAHIPSLREHLLELYKISFQNGLEKYKSSGIPPKEYLELYYSLFQSQIKVSVDNCLQFYKDMWHLGLEQPNVLHYLVSANIVARDYNYVIKWAKRIQAKKIPLNNHCYRGLLVAYCKTGEIDEAIDLIRNSIRAGKRPPSKIIGYILKSTFNQKNKFKETINLVSNFQWNHDCYHCVIKFYSKHKEWTKCLEYWNQYTNYTVTFNRTVSPEMIKLISDAALENNKPGIKFKG